MTNSLAQLNFIDSDDPQRTVEHIVTDWKNGDKHLIVHYMYYSNFILLDKDPDFRASMLLANYILIDGIGMQLYLKATKSKWVNNLNGTDLSPAFLKYFDQQQIPIAFYGTTQENIKSAKNNIETYLPNNSIYYIQDGFTPLDWSALQQNSVLFIGLGSPLQENWVKNNYEKLTKKKILVITVGGFFDFASGFYIRAPKLIRTFKLEWAWRTILHPKRHLSKRLRDFTIFYRPFKDIVTGKAKSIKIRNI